ncbi:unnamed protein product, partial [Symbiodinium sp. CCMP2592]
VRCVHTAREDGTKAIIEAMAKGLRREEAPDRRFRTELGFGLSKLKKGGYDADRLGEITRMLRATV